MKTGKIRMRARAPMREVAAKATEPEETAIDEADAAASELEPAEKKERSSAAPRESKPQQEMRNNEDRNLKEWLESIAPGGAIRVKVSRTDPKTWKGMNVGGSLATYDQQVDEDWIREHHGGGTFFLNVTKPKPNGSGWIYAGGRVLRIGGDPRTDDVYRDKSGESPAVVAANPAGGIVDRVVGSLERQLEREQARSAPQGPDIETMRMMLSPMQRQLDSQAAMIAEKDRQLAEAQKPVAQPRDEFRDKMLDKLLDGDSARIAALRSQYESELRQVKQSSMDNEARLRDSFERDKLALAMSHERELNAVRGAYDMKCAAQEQSHSTTGKLMDSEIRRMQGDLTEAKSELAALRLKKDKTILEQASEFAAIKEAIGDITGDDAKEKSGLEKILEAAGNFPAVQNMISKVGGGGAPAPAPPPPPQPTPRPSRLLTGPDGNLYRQLPDGNVQLVRKRPARPDGAPHEAPIPVIPPMQLKIAVDYLESAFRGQQDPEVVATSVRAMIPAEVLTLIKDRGIDFLLTDVAKLDGGSPLGSQAGRNWARKVGKSLVGE